MLTNETREALSRLPALRGAALSILVAMMIAGREHRFLAKDLEVWTGYGADAITSGLHTLTLLGAITDHGRRRGWSLNTGWHQLGILFPGLVDNPVDNSGYLPAGDDLSPEKPDSNFGANGLNPEKPDSVLVNENLSPEKPDSKRPVIQLNPEKPDSNGVNGHLSPEKPDSKVQRSTFVDRSDLISDRTNNERAAALCTRLEALRPPFMDAAAFVDEHSPTHIAAWLDYIEGLDGQARKKLKSESAFLARRVIQGKYPPRPRKQPKREHIPEEYMDIIKR